MIAAVAWHYWLVVPLLAADVAAVLAMAWLYLRRILVPRYEWRARQQAAAAAPEGGQEAEVVPLGASRVPAGTPRAA